MRVLLALGALAVLGNVAFYVVHDRLTSQRFVEPQEVRSEQVALAAAAGGGRVVAATRSDELLLLEGGRVSQRHAFDALIGAVATAPKGKAIYVGLSDGRVVALDGSLRRERELQVSGRVVGLAATGEGGLVVGHGVGAYSDRYYVSYYPRPKGEPAFAKKVDFTISGLDVLNGMAVFSTLNSRVGAIDTGGSGEEIAWTAALSHPVTRLLALPEGGQVLAGTEGGSLTLLNGQGAVLGEVPLSQYPLRGLAHDGDTGTYFVGDARGNLYALDESGELLLTKRIAESDIEALIPSASGSLLAIPREGQWQVVNPAAIEAVRQAGQVRVGWLAFGAGMVAAMFAASILLIRRLYTAVRRVVVAPWRSRLAYGFMLPALALTLLFSYYPVATAVYYSLTNFSLRNVTEFIGVENYRRVLTGDFYFRTGMLNMLIIVVTSAIKTLTVPLLVAELVFQLRNHVHQYVFRTLFVLPAVVPGLVFTLLWRQVYDPRTGLLNQLLGAVGLDRFQQAWLGDESTALWAIIGVGFPYVDAFAFLILLGGLLNINSEFYDAAKVDGASMWSRFRNIDLPLLRPQFRILLFFAITGAVQGFAGIFILTQGGPGYSTYVPALQMYLRISQGDFGYASAIGVILFVMILLPTLFILRFRRQEAIETV